LPEGLPLNQDEGGKLGFLIECWPSYKAPLHKCNIDLSTKYPKMKTALKKRNDLHKKKQPKIKESTHEKTVGSQLMVMNTDCHLQVAANEHWHGLETVLKKRLTMMMKLLHEIIEHSSVDLLRINIEK